MSQAGHLSVSASPSVATTYTTDNGNSVPAANILNILARDTSANNDNGRQTVAVPSGGAYIYVELTNRVQGSDSTVGAPTVDITLMDFSAAPFSGIPGAYTFDFRVAAFESTGPSAGIYSLFAGLKTDGTTPILIGDTDKVVHEDAALSTADVSLVMVGNELRARVTGVAALTIAWDIVGEYTRSI